MDYPDEYISFLVHFHGSRDYFECHEILEEYWKEVSPRERDSHWVGLIQVAVGLYHSRRSNTKGALKTLRKAKAILEKKQVELNRLGIAAVPFLHILQEEIQRIQSGQPYQSFNFPITDPALIETCKKASLAANYSWCTPSNLEDHFLINRHTRRDRSEVIQERNRQLELRILDTEIKE